MKHVILFILLLQAFMSSAQPQDDDRKAAPSGGSLENLFSFVHNIEQFNHNFPQEKVYLHFDNTG
ncbi:MAG: hypothetical protein Q4C43_03120, partial [Prevotella sp.]|nr:hypothetical protein [Prevotella sp.]